jgi:hypothetical protein
MNDKIRQVFMCFYLVIFIVLCLTSTREEVEWWYIFHKIAANAQTNIKADVFLTSEILVISCILPICQSYDNIIGDKSRRALNDER